ncbi:MAG: GTP-binding protein, partial [Desulfobacteraceae bacterium]
PIADMLAGFEQRKIWLEGVKTVILGRVNVGKSSLLNQLAHEERAIVTPIPGTTRDVIETFIHIEGVPFRIMDTAGFRKAKGEVEKIGLRLTQTKTQEADLILLLLDQSRALHALDLDLLANLDKNKTLLILNKTDLPRKLNPEQLHQAAGPLPLLKISARTGEGLEALRQTLLKKVVTREDSAADITPSVPNLRHKEALEKAAQFFQQAIAGLENRMPPEIIALDLHAGSQALAEIIGATTPEDVLERIFSRFCIGK